jgi:TonB family protein
MLEFNVNEQGKTEDIEVVWSTNKSFNQNAKKTVERFLYQPQIEEGKPVKVEGVLNQITFIIEGKSKPRNYIPEGCS